MQKVKSSVGLLLYQWVWGVQAGPAMETSLLSLLTKSRGIYWMWPSWCTLLGLPLHHDKLLVLEESMYIGQGSCTGWQSPGHQW
jgi:hypothetical protein